MPYTDEEISDAAELYPSLWVIKHGIKTEAGFPIEFKKRRFLTAMYDDMSPKQVEMKPPQIGLTVKAIVKTIWVAKKLKRDIIYTLPTQGDVEDMASDKINRIIAQNPILQQWINEHDTVSQKSVGNNIIHYRGTFTSKQAMMVSSGLNVHDEVDASDPAVINQYETRLEGQENEDMKWRWYFSHPSIAGQGVDIQWQQSDMKEWYIKCNECEEEQVLTWPESIDIPSGAYICKHCRKPLADESRINGRWKNRDGVAWEGTIQGDYKFSGWHVSQLMLWNKTAQDIINSFNDPTKDQQYFWNYVLGLPYAASDDRIEPAVVLRNCIDIVNPRTERTVIGCDTGHGLHYVLMNKSGVFFYDYAGEITATKDPYDVIRGHLRKFPKSIAVFDQGGDLIGVRKLVQEYPGRIFLCFYNLDRKTVDFVEWGENDEYWKVRVDRNRTLTLMVEQLRDVGRIPLNGTKEEWTEFASHFGYMYREKLLVKETRGKDNRDLYGARYVWKRRGPDHYAHALNYALTGLQRYGGEAATIVGESPYAGMKSGQVVTPGPEQSFISLSPQEVAAQRIEL